MKRKRYWAKSYSHFRMGGMYKWGNIYSVTVWDYMNGDMVIGFIEKTIAPEGEELGRYFAFIQPWGKPSREFNDYAHLRSAKRAIERECR